MALPGTSVILEIMVHFSAKLALKTEPGSHRFLNSSLVLILNEVKWVIDFRAKHCRGAIRRKSPSRFYFLILYNALE